MDELESLYEVLENSVNRLDILPTISIARYVLGDNWVVYRRGKAVDIDSSGEVVHRSLRAAIHRAWELEQQP